MSKSRLADTLQQMAEAQTGRSETSRLRAVLPEIEQALAAGVRRQMILEALHQDGFTMTMRTFEKALYRIRKGAKSKSNLTLDRSISKTIKSSREAEVTHAPKPPINFRKLREEMDNVDLSALANEGKKL